MMKKILSLVLALTFILTLTACSNSDKGRILYNVKLDKFITLSEYEGIEIDTKSEELEKYLANVISADVEALDLYVKIYEGVLKEGDVANIDYVGKIDGKEFEGGKDEGYDLELGSDSFIDGFEDKLVGVKIGSTVDLNLTFPDNYKEELAGKDVVFTVKVNYVKTDEEREPEDFYKELDYETVDDYYKDAKKSAAKNYIVAEIIEKSEIEKYPEADKEFLLEQRIKSLETSIKNSYNMTLEDYLSAIGKTEDEIKETLISNYVEPMMQEQMMFYAIFDKEKMTATDKEIEDKTKEIVASYNSDKITAETIKEYYGEYYFEYSVISEKVIEFLYESAKIS